MNREYRGLRHNTPVIVPNGRVGRVKSQGPHGTVRVDGVKCGTKWSYFGWYQPRELQVIDDERYDALSAAWTEIDEIAKIP